MTDVSRVGPYWFSHRAVAVCVTATAPSLVVELMSYLQVHLIHHRMQPTSVPVWHIRLVSADERFLPHGGAWRCTVEASRNIILRNSESLKIICVYVGLSSSHVWTQDVYSQIRVLIQDSLRPRGCLEIHAASVVWQERGLLLLGDKGAGKTTVSYYLHLVEHAAYVSADRLLIWGEGMRLRTSGTISSYRMTLQDLQLFPMTEQHTAVISQCEREMSKRDVLVHGKVRLDPRTLIRLLGIACATTAQPDAIWFLEEGPGPYRLNAISSRQAWERLSRFSISDTKPPADETLERLSTCNSSILSGRGRLDEILELRP